MPRTVAYNPRAYIPGMRNFDRGLSSRTKIINALENAKLKVPDIAEKTGLSKSAVNYHLHLLHKRKIVASSRIGRKTSWMMTRYGQERLFH